MDDKTRDEGVVLDVPVLAPEFDGLEVLLLDAVVGVSSVTVSVISILSEKPTLHFLHVRLSGS